MTVAYLIDLAEVGAAEGDSRGIGIVPARIARGRRTFRSRLAGWPLEIRWRPAASAACTGTRNPNRGEYSITGDVKTRPQGRSLMDFRRIVVVFLLHSWRDWYDRWPVIARSRGLLGFFPPPLRFFFLFSPPIGLPPQAAG